MYKELSQLDGRELEMLAVLIDTDMPRMCALLFPERQPGEETLVKNIGQWAINRKVALDNQIQQNPNVALVFEKICYRIWQKLPSHARNLKVKADAIMALAMENQPP